MGDSGAPRDAAFIEGLLQEMGVKEYDPLVVHQLLEVSYRYVTTVLEDAKVYSEHAQKKEVDVSDVKLAVETRIDHSFTSPPPKEVLLEFARQRNSMPLPLVPEKFGLRLPPERYCLSGPNYRVKHKPKQPVGPAIPLTATFRHQLATAGVGAGLGVGPGLEISIPPSVLGQMAGQQSSHQLIKTDALTGTSVATTSTSSIGAFILSPLLTSQQTTAMNSQGGGAGSGTSTIAQLGVPSTVMSLFGASPVSSGSLTSSDDLPSMPSVTGGAPNATHS